MKEISYQEFNKLPKESYNLIDIRDEGLRDYGMIPGAIYIDVEGDEEEAGREIAKLSQDKKFIFYCEIGRKTRDLDASFLDGIECYS